ncbi:conserved hypothetical protein [Gammaproteobacteria bacterium]
MTQTLSIYPEGLASLSVGQLAHLPANQLAEVYNNLDQLATWLKKTRAKVDAALEQRYGESCRTALLQSGRDFGITHIQDEEIQVSYDLPKRVSWDQAKLAVIAKNLAASGERLEDYIDVELSVSESRYKAWPSRIQEQFTPARTVKPGKVSIKLAIDNE